MTPDEARRKVAALRRMTIDRGATPAEADTAQRLAANLVLRFQLDERAPNVAQDRFRNWNPERETQRAARQYQWEYRKCGKSNCWCRFVDLHRAHGPYRYGKRRRGKYVTSVYVGR